jgi:Sec-independent protein translocase protein TatA
LGSAAAGPNIEATVLALLDNLGFTELLVIAVVALLLFGKDLPRAASKAYLEFRKLRNKLDDLRRDSGIERELRDIERSVREAEWEARRRERLPASPAAAAPTPASGTPGSTGSGERAPEHAPQADASPPSESRSEEPRGPTGAAS